MPARSRSGDFDIPMLAALLPAALGEWTLESLGQPLPTPLPDMLPALQATYTRGTQTAFVTMNTRLSIPAAKGSREIQQQRREDRKENVAMLPLSNGLVIIVTSRSSEAAALADLIRSIDLDRAEKLQRKAK